MTRTWAFALAGLAAAAVSAIAACGRHDRSGQRMIVLGFDGMDYRLTRELMDSGRMPNFSKVAAAGAFDALASTIPPQSPVAWSSFITGQDPSGHAIFDFLHRDPETMLPYLSTTRTEGASRMIGFGGWQLPLAGGRVTLLREGQPFWDVLEQHGVRTTIMRMPANFPPSGLATHELSGMGTPDILGTYGTFSFFTSAPDPAMARTLSGGRVFTVDVIDDVVRGELEGPDNPFRTPPRKLSVPFTVYIDPVTQAAKVVVGREERVLKAGDWSDWIPVEFPLMPTQTLRGITRFYVKQLKPVFELYASPINIDPLTPAMRISTPAGYARALAEAGGRFYTQGMAEDTKSVVDGVLSRDEFLQQAAIAGDEVTRQYWRTLDGFENGLLFYYFGNLDQVSHIMWRARDPEHPAYDAARDVRYRSVIEDLYVAFDRIVGETLKRIDPDTTLIVMSDHGFASWRRSFHLNGWLRDHGYLTVADPARRDDPGLFQNVDWSRTRAYGLGLNGLYVNLAGRERVGIVAARDRDALLQEIRQKLLETIDPQSGRPAITRVFPGHRSDSTRDAGAGPDLIIGYALGTRVSNESALGGLAGDVLVNNTSEWSGDHCMDPDAVPGILLSSRRLSQPARSLDAVAGAILAEFGIRGFPASR